MSKIQDYTSEIIEGIKAGREDITDMLLKESKEDYNFGLEQACMYGNEVMVRYMLEKGGESYNDSMENVCTRGSISIAKILIDKAREKINLNSMQEICYENGHIELAEYFESLGANNWNGSLKIAIEQNNFTLIKKMILLGADDKKLLNKLNDDAILYLLDENVPRDKLISSKCEKFIKRYEVDMNLKAAVILKYLINDLANICSSYLTVYLIS